MNVLKLIPLTAVDYTSSHVPHWRDLDAEGKMPSQCLDRVVVEYLRTRCNCVPVEIDCHEGGQWLVFRRNMEDLEDLFTEGPGFVLFLPLACIFPLFCFSACAPLQGRAHESAILSARERTRAPF